MQSLPKAHEGIRDVSSLPGQQQVKGLLRAFLALRHRNFRLFWFGQMISLTGTWMQTIGQAWLVLQLTQSAWLLGIVGALQFLPVMLLSLFGGVLADRVPKRKVLLFTQSFAMLQAAVLWILVATGEVRLWHVLVLATLLGLTNAIALNSSLFNLARIVGPGIGGIIIAWMGVAPLFLLNAISFIPVIIGLALIDLSGLYAQGKRLDTIHKADTAKQSTWQSLREGLAYVVHTPSILLIIAVVGIVSLFGINFNVVLPLFATSVLHTGAEGFGFISSAFGLGSLLCALWLAWSNHKPTIHYLLVSAFVFCGIEAFFAISQFYALSLVLIAGVGFAMIAFSATANTTVQTVAPDHLRGRVMSVYMLVFAGSIPFGNLITGGLAHLFGAPVALLVGAGVSLVAVISAWVLRKPAEKDLAKPAYDNE